MTILSNVSFPIQFASLLLTILIIQVAIAIYTFIALKNADDINFKEEYAQKIFNNYKNKENNTKEFVDLIQHEVSLLK